MFVVGESIRLNVVWREKKAFIPSLQNFTNPIKTLKKVNARIITSIYPHYTALVDCAIKKDKVPNFGKCEKVSQDSATPLSDL